MQALRLHSVTMPVPDLPAAEKFYRWVLGMKASAEGPVENGASLGWGREDRVVLLDAGRDPDAREAVEVRLAAAEPAATARWLAERGLAPARVTAFEEDAETLQALWPGAELLTDDDIACSNRYVLSLDAPVDTRIDLHVPFPASTVVAAARHGPFYRRTREWRGLENPGLLGATLGAADPVALVAFLGHLGIAPMESSDGDGEADPPLGVGDHQLRIERRDPPGLYGAAFVVAASRIPDLVRTLERFDAPHRHERNHLLAVDPAGRVLAVNGVRSG